MDESHFLQTVLPNLGVVLPGLPQSDVTKLVISLRDVTGVETIEDLKFVTEADLIQVLKPICARKLIAAWNEHREYRTM